ncbi:MAG: vitamin K epoxide reductase [Firmicutes bacterium]|nr:vitamin K epoxide reductase [Bacillota bacterium]
MGRYLPVACTVVIVGASLATLLLVIHPNVIGCPGSQATSVIDCRAVVTSPGGRILGLPLGFWALVWLAAFWLVAGVRGPSRLWWMTPWAVVGVAYAVGTELRVGHICAWCSLDQLAILTLAIWGTRQVGRRSAPDDQGGAVG